MGTSEEAVLIAIENDVEKKFNVFVKAYVSEFESELEKYDTEAAVGWKGYVYTITATIVALIAKLVPHLKKWLDGKKSSDGYENWVVSIVIVLITASICFVIENYFAKRDRETAKKITQVFDSMQKEDLRRKRSKKEELRRMLAEAAGSIFYSYQSQFMLVTDADGNFIRRLLSRFSFSRGAGEAREAGQWKRRLMQAMQMIGNVLNPFRFCRDASEWKRGLKKLAMDARHRSLSYINKEKYVIPSMDLLTQGLVKGESKATILSRIFPRALQQYIPGTKPGLTISLETRLYETSDLYEKVAVKIVVNDGQTKCYKLNGTDCGCRNSFSWEDEDLLLTSNYKECDPKELQDIRIYLRPEQKEALIDMVLKEINKNDHKFMSNKTVENTDEIKETLKSVAKKDDIENAMKKFKIKANILSELPEKVESILNVDAPVKTFTGRTKELDELHEKLQIERKHVVVSQCASISGLGGIGKSELARRYAFEYEDFYYHRIWINSEERSSIINYFQELAKDLKIPIADNDENKSDQKKPIEKNLKSILRKIYERLAKDQTLIIFDNVDQFEDIKDFLPPNLSLAYKRPAVIITSRNNYWDAGDEGKVDVILLEEFTPDEATSYVKKSLQIIDEDSYYDHLIDELIKVLCYFPLALHQAVSCIKSKKILSEANKQKILTRTFKEYLKEFSDEKNKGNLLKKKPGNYDRYTETIYTTWRVTFKNIKNKGPYGDLALFLVEIMSYLTPDDISFEEIFAKVVKDQEKLEEAIDILVKYSIITVHQNKVAQTRGSIHRLVQLVVRLWINEEKREEDVLRLILRRVYEYLDDDQRLPLLSYVCNYTTMMNEYLRMSYKNIVFNFRYKVLNYHIENGNVCTVQKILDYLLRKRDLWPLPYRDIFHAEGVYCHPKIVESAEDGDHDDGGKGGKEDSEHEKHIKKVYLIHAEVNNALKTSTTEELERFLKSFDKRLIKSWCNSDTALRKSVESGNLDVVKILIEEGAGTNIRNIDYDGLLNVALQCKHPKIAEYLLDRGAHPNPEPDAPERKPIHYAAMFGYVKIMKRLAVTKEEFENRSGADWRPLHLAAENDQLEIVEFLISKGVDVTALTRDGQTACHIAVEKGNIRIVKHLIDKQLVDVNMRNITNKTLLYTAVEHGHFDIVKYLLTVKSRIKADINDFDEWGVTPLLKAVAHGNIGIVRYLMQHGASVGNVQSESTRFGKLKLSALRLAAALNLIDLAASVDNVQNETTPLGQLKLSALHCAAVSDCFEVAKILVEDLKADINMGLDTTVTPLQIAKTLNSTKVRDFLLEKGADESAKNNSDYIRCIFHSFVEDKANSNHYNVSLKHVVRTHLTIYDLTFCYSENRIDNYDGSSFFIALISDILKSRKYTNETVSFERCLAYQIKHKHLVGKLSNVLRILDYNLRNSE